MRQEFKKGLPRYLDGELELFEISTTDENGFFKDQLKSTGIKIKFEKIAIFDRTRFEEKARGIELTLKLRIPKTEINSIYFVKINGVFHEIGNAAEIIDNRDNFKKTELTLIKYSQNYEVIE